jgi:hypothetical protein
VEKAKKSRIPQSDKMVRDHIALNSLHGVKNLLLFICISTNTYEMPNSGDRKEDIN